MKKILATVMTLVMIMSTVTSFGATTTTGINYNERGFYLEKRGVLDAPANRSTVGYNTTATVTRLTAAIVISRVMKVTDDSWTPTTTHPFVDVPDWANTYVATVNGYGIMKGVDGTHFSPYKEISANDYLTILLRALGYGYNDSVQEFNWDNSIDFAYSVGLMDESEYNLVKNKTTFTRGDMIMLSYNAVKNLDNNPYTDEYLTSLIKKNPPSNEIKALRAKDDATRNGLLHESFVYFDIYYPDTKDAKETLDLLRPHANKVYAMLQDLYGFQAAMDIYLVDNAYVDSEKTGPNTIVKNEHMTYVVIGEGLNDAGGNNLAEFVENINMTFYFNLVSDTMKKEKISFKGDDFPWKVAATRNIIASMYTEHNYSGYVDQMSINEIPTLRTLVRDQSMGKPVGGMAYGASLMEVYYVSKLLNSKDASGLKGILSTFGTGTELKNRKYSTPNSVLEIDRMFAH